MSTYTMTYQEDKMILVSTDIKRQLKILKSVASFTHITVEQITGRSRKEDIVYARQLAVFLLNKFTKYSYVKIGEILGNRDHATIIHSLKVMADRMATEPHTATDVKTLENIIHKRL